MSQFLDPNSQQLVAARFNAQHAANLVATNHFADQFGVSDPSQFVTVVQQQQNTATQQFHNVANNFNFFQQPQNLAIVGTPATSSAPNMNMTSRRPAQGQSHMDQLAAHQSIDQTSVSQHHLLDHNQQLACVNPMSADNLSNHLANGSPFIFDQTNGVIRIPHTSVLDASNAIVVNSITSSLRQQQHHHQLHHNQNYQQHSNSLSTAIDGPCQQNLINNHRVGAAVGGHANRANRPPDENGYRRPDGGGLASLNPSANGGGGGVSRSTAKSGSGPITNQTSKTSDMTKCKSSRSRNKKIQKPDKIPDPSRRTFACPTCGKGFTENFNMKRHMQIHSQSRPKFSCDECSKSFAWKDNFVRHKKAAHDNVIESFPIQ